MTFIYKFNAPEKQTTNNSQNGEGMNMFLQEQIKMLIAMTNSFTKLEANLAAIKDKLDSQHNKLHSVGVEITDINTGIDQVHASISQLREESKEHIKEARKSQS